MKLTLRAARNLEGKLRGLDIAGRLVKIRAYDAEVAYNDMTSAQDNLGREIGLKVDLTEIRFEIKNMINEANMECGVSDLLNTRDMLNAKRDLLNGLDTSDSLTRQINLIKSSEPEDSKIANVYGKDLEQEVDDMLIEIEDELNEISKKLQLLNNSVTIELDNETVELLTEQGVL
jgi:hypothetical protein